MKEAVLKIYYKDSQGNLHHEPQGKFYYLNGKAVFLADMTPSKWWRNYGGYSIAKQIVEGFSKAKVKPQIVYRRRDLGTIYVTNATTFTKAGILINFGNHRQYVLPVKNFKVYNENIKIEKKELPEMDLAVWLKDEPEEEKIEFIGNTAHITPIRKPEALKQSEMFIDPADGKDKTVETEVRL